MTTFVNDSTKHASTFVGDTPSNPTFSQFPRHGKELGMDFLVNKTFTDTVYEDNPKELKDFTFEELQDQQWVSDTKS